VAVTIVEFETEGAGVVLVQVAGDLPAGVVTRGIGVTQAVEKVERSFGKALGTIQAVANGVLEQLNGLGRRPDEVHIEFGLEFTATAGTAVLAAAGGNVHLNVSMTWQASPPQSADERPHAVS
jgi:hypothetical protein